MAQSGALQGAARFRIERELSDTLQGRIYAGVDLVTNRPVVVKEAWRQLVRSGRSRKGHQVAEDFLKERHVLMTLTNLPDSDSGLVKGIDEWDDEQCYYYAMELCEGELFEYISDTHKGDYTRFVQAEAAKPQVPMAKPNEWVLTVTRMFYDICKTVQWLHGKGYCHLDLSLENTMIATLEQLIVKIIDLGVSQKLDDKQYRHKGRIGKVQYMCPEAYARKAYDARAADVWCLGVMLFMMLIGAPPYPVPQRQNPAFNFIVRGRLADVLKHWKRIRLVTPEALDLLNRIFKWEDNRISLPAILEHPFFASIVREAPKPQESSEEEMEVHENTDDSPVHDEQEQLLSHAMKQKSIELNQSTSSAAMLEEQVENKEANAGNKGTSGGKEVKAQAAKPYTGRTDVTTKGGPGTDKKQKEQANGKGHGKGQGKEDDKEKEKEQKNADQAQEMAPNASMIKGGKKRGAKKLMCGVNRCTIA